MSFSFLPIANSTMVLSLDTHLERQRASLYEKVLIAHGKRETYQDAYPYHRYAAMNPKTRCFDNAIATARRYTLRYIEGLVFCALSFPYEGQSVFPLAHGWCEDYNGRLIDPTLHQHQDNKSLLYVGVPLFREYVDKWYEQTGYYGCLDGDQQGRPIGIHYDPPSLWREPEPRNYIREIANDCKKEKDE